MRNVFSGESTIEVSPQELSVLSKSFKKPVESIIVPWDYTGPKVPEGGHQVLKLSLSVQSTTNYVLFVCYIKLQSSNLFGVNIPCFKNGEMEQILVGERYE